MGLGETVDGDPSGMEDSASLWEVRARSAVEELVLRETGAAARRLGVSLPPAVEEIYRIPVRLRYGPGFAAEVVQRVAAEHGLVTEEFGDAPGYLAAGRWRAGDWLGNREQYLPPPDLVLSEDGWHSYSVQRSHLPEESVRTLAEEDRLWVRHVERRPGPLRTLAGRVIAEAATGHSSSVGRATASLPVQSGRHVLLTLHYSDRSLLDLDDVEAFGVDGVLVTGENRTWPCAPGMASLLSSWRSASFETLDTHVYLPPADLSPDAGLLYVRLREGGADDVDARRLVELL